MHKFDPRPTFAAFHQASKDLVFLAITDLDAFLAAPPDAEVSFVRPYADGDEAAGTCRKGDLYDFAIATNA